MQNGNWRQRMMKLHQEYFFMVREIGATREHRGYAQTVLGLEDEYLKLLTDLDDEEIKKLADVGVLLLRPKMKDLTRVLDFYRKGNEQAAEGLLATALTADGVKGGEA